jgi:hypothetical protein
VEEEEEVALVPHFVVVERGFQLSPRHTVTNTRLKCSESSERERKREKRKKERERERECFTFGLATNATVYDCDVTLPAVMAWLTIPNSGFL